MNGFDGKQMDGCIECDGQIDGWMALMVNRWMDVLNVLDEWIDGCMDRWMDGWL